MGVDLLRVQIRRIASPAASDETFTREPLDARGISGFRRVSWSSPLRVSRVKRRLFGSNEESISISQVASVKISTGMLWSDIRD